MKITVATTLLVLYNSGGTYAIDDFAPFGLMGGCRGEGDNLFSYFGYQTQTNRDECAAFCIQNTPPDQLPYLNGMSVSSGTIPECGKCACHFDGSAFPMFNPFPPIEGPSYEDKTVQGAITKTGIENPVCSEQCYTHNVSVIIMCTCFLNSKREAF